MEVQTFTVEPSSEAAFADWRGTFQLLDRSEDIQDVLRESPSVQALHAKLVPVELAYRTFWERYFFRVHCLDEEEAKRVRAMARAARPLAEERLDLGWEEDDEASPVADEGPGAPAASAGVSTVAATAAGPVASTAAAEAPPAGDDAAPGTSVVDDGRAPCDRGRTSGGAGGSTEQPATACNEKAPRVDRQAHAAGVRVGDMCSQGHVGEARLPPQPAAAPAHHVNDDAVDVISMSSIAASSMSFQLVGTSEAVRSMGRAMGKGFFELISSPACPLCAAGLGAARAAGGAPGSRMESCRRPGHGQAE